MFNTPLVSILIPNFNKEKFVRETVDSILKQSYSNWECIIVDDHSSDGSWEVLQGVKLNDSRFKILKRPLDRKKGGNAARNFAFENSKGDYIQWLDSDDLIHPKKIEIQLEDLKEKSYKTVSLSNWEGFDPLELNHGLKIQDRWYRFPQDGYSFLLNLWGKEQFVPPHAYLISRNILKMSGLWNENLIQNQDGEFMTRVLLASEGIVFNHNILAYYRLPNSTHLSKQITFRSWHDWLESLLLCDQWILNHRDTKEARNILILNYERLIKLTISSYPEIAQKALDQIKQLNPFIKLSFSKPQVIWFGAWIGISRFLKLRSVFKS